MNEDKIITKLMEHDRRFDTLETDFKDFKQQVFTSLDEMLSILRRLDEERITTAWVKRIEKEGEEYTREIARIKSELKIN